MLASRIGVTGACCSARFWFTAFCAALMPTSIGYQDLAALIARERAPPSHWHLIISPVQAATFSYSRPIGSAVPQPLGSQTVNFDPRSLDAFSWKIDEPIHARPARQMEYPTVERSRKADRLPTSLAAPAPIFVQPPADQLPRAPTVPLTPQAQQAAPANNDVASNTPPSPPASGAGAAPAAAGRAPRPALPLPAGIRHPSCPAQ